MIKTLFAAVVAVGMFASAARAENDIFSQIFAPQIAAPVTAHDTTMNAARAEVRHGHRTRTARHHRRYREALAQVQGYADERAAVQELAEVSGGPETSYVAYSGSAYEIGTRIARQHGISPALVHAVIRVESNGNCRATSTHGARGAMQVKPRTAAGVGVHGNLHDCATGILAGVRYLKQALSVNGGSICAAASSYNTGTGIRGRCSGYGRKVVALMGRARYASL